MQKFLAGVRYPARKHELLKRARSRGADEDVLRVLGLLPERDYESPVSLACEIGRQTRR